jgi:hypothetical protein
MFIILFLIVVIIFLLEELDEYKIQELKHVEDFNNDIIDKRKYKQS